MNLVTVKAKFQVVIPQDVRRRAGVGIGDLLDVNVEDGKITLTPKSVVDRHVAEGLEDLRLGRVGKPFASGREAVAAIEAGAGKRTAKPRR